jgi:disulfide bond formation protein DsbB
VTHDAVVVFALFGVAGQVVLAAFVFVGILRLFGIRGPLDAVRHVVWGYELWLAFLVAALATGGSLFYSEIANFVPCELCWYQRICMYPLTILTLLPALASDYRIARYLLPLPAVGACIAVYQILIEEDVVKQTQACLISAPGGCATKWTDTFGYLTIPVLTLTAFLLALVFLILACFELRPEGSTS